MLSIQTQLILAAIDQIPEQEYAAFMKEFEKKRKGEAIGRPKKKITFDPMILAQQFLVEHRKKHSVASKLA
jgi:hypothetical protein